MKNIHRLLISLFIGLFFACSFFIYKTFSAPLLANYFLGTLPKDVESIDKLSKTDLLILSPEQAVTSKDIIAQIKKKNPNIIFLAYVSAKSYNENWKSYPANVLYDDFLVKDEWWLRDTKGNIVSNWPGLKSANMSAEWSDYLINFVQTKILAQGIWDGILWDEVYDGLATVNKGDLDLNGDGEKDDSVWVNAEWVRRTNYLLDKSQKEFKVKYILTNGSSIESMQKYINGRMYESYPTPWESNGVWSSIMTKLEQLKLLNQQPQMYVFNGNTNNTGKKDNYRQMRFGLISSLLTDNVYFSYDYGDKDHSQVWWYDEYNVRLGEPLGEAQSLFGQAKFKDGVWRRDYTNGVVLLNTTFDSKTVDLGGEYERIIGTQDPAVNDGRIEDKVVLGARDGLVMYKTYSKVDNVFHKNGSFLRFYEGDGARARNGFFSFEEDYLGGVKIYQGDLNGDGRAEKILATGNKLEIFNNEGGRWFLDYPFGGNFKGEINLAVGKLYKGKEMQIVVAPSRGGEVIVYNYHGQVIKSDWFPLGKKYNGGFSVAIGDTDGKGGKIIFGAGVTRASQVFIYDNSWKLKKQFYPYEKKYNGRISVAAGNFDGMGAEDLVVSADGKKPIRMFNGTGKKMSEFTVNGFFGNEALTLAAIERPEKISSKDELVIMSDN